MSLATPRGPVRALAASASLAFALLAACGGSPKPAAPVTGAGGGDDGPKGPATPTSDRGVDKDALARASKPCDDFYAFACGAWIEKTTIPDDESTWMRSFSTIRDRNEATLKGILERYAKGDVGDDPHGKQLGDFWGACMDEAALEKLGKKPLEPTLAKVKGLKDGDGLAKLLAELHVRGIGALFVLEAGQDLADSSKVVAHVGQGGLGLPDREYYLDEDAKKADLRTKYLAHVGRVFALLGEPKATAEASAKTVMKVERVLAEASMTKEDRRDPKKLHNPKKREELAAFAPGFAWETYFEAAKARHATDVNVAMPAFAKAVGEVVAGKGKTPVTLAELKTYLTWHVARASLPFLSKPFVEENLAWKKELVGVPKLPERWKRCVRATDGAMGEAVARPFVKETLGESGAGDVKSLIEGIEATMGKSLETLAWMDDATRAQAKRKLQKIANKVVAPEKLRSYAGLTVERGTYLENLARAASFEHARQMAKIGKPVDRTEWLMTPPSVNAYYDPSMNEMVFPAGILQPPFYAKDAARPVNLGGIGMVMGHELTHGFDDEGRQFDADGNLADWWSPKVGEEFDHRAACVAEQFDGYTVLGDAKVNGKLTLGENIADLGGVKLAYETLRRENLAKDDASEFTPEQSLFLGFAQSWCGKYRDEALRLLVATNPHSPPSLRVNGPLSNLDAFAKAFSCKPGDAMVRPKACVVW